MSGSEAPIFIQGVLFRSGTNYLARLLERHPDCVLSTIPEDWLLSQSDHLIRYTRGVGGRWRWVKDWGLGEETEQALLRELGAALLGFLRGRCENEAGRRLITKTPDVAGLPNFVRLFPEAHLLVLIRDGRSVVESSVRSFGWPADRVTRWWAEGADRILNFLRAHPEGSDRYQVVRYEDLVLEPEKVMRAIFRFLDLDPERYDFAGLGEVPVYGSSTVRGTSGAWAWTVRPNDRDLGALERYRDWSRLQHERFNWIAGQQLRELGYEPKRFTDRALHWRFARLFWAFEDVARRWRARIKLARGRRG